MLALPLAGKAAGLIEKETLLLASFIRARPLAKKTASLLEKETLKKANNEQRTTNDE